MDSAGDLVTNLEAVRDGLCADATTMPDSELSEIAKWAWQCRLNNSIFRGRDSALVLGRELGS